MSQRSNRVYIKKEALKFSAAHMTVFADGTKEPLHGHNYTTEVVFDIPALPLQKGLISFSELKKEIKTICDQWDETVLLAQNCPFFNIVKQSDEELEFVLCQKRYVLPREEVVLLPLDNITSESLAQEFCRRLATAFKPRFDAKEILGLQVKVEESPGQGSIWIW
jgi:6-pyruvoyltetrahydropterin/6-carboxytetrahydropterin synthase